MTAIDLMVYYKSLTYRDESEENATDLLNDFLAASKPITHLVRCSTVPPVARYYIPAGAMAQLDHVIALIEEVIASTDRR